MPEENAEGSDWRLAVDAHGNPLRVLITAGTTTDCPQAGRLIAGIAAEHLVANRGYDTNS